MTMKSNFRRLVEANIYNSSNELVFLGLNNNTKLIFRSSTNAQDVAVFYEDKFTNLDYTISKDDITKLISYLQSRATKKIIIHQSSNYKLEAMKKSNNILIYSYKYNALLESFELLDICAYDKKDALYELSHW